MKVLIIIAAVLMPCLAGVWYMMSFSGDNVNVKGQKLNEYTNSSGGDMNGGYYKKTIKRYDDKHALYSSESATWHAQLPEVKEYLIDVKVLDDIKDVFLNNKMNWWKNKKFTNMFIADGESHSYYFSFDSEWVYLSSQHYPEKYAKKLALIDDAIKPYRNNMKLLPGLVVPKPEEECTKYVPCKQAVGIYACQYRENYLYYKIVNDTEEDVDCTTQPVIKFLKNDSLVYSSAEKQTIHINKNRDEERYVRLSKRLEEGTYELSIGDYYCKFEITESHD